MRPSHLSSFVLVCALLALLWTSVAGAGVSHVIILGIDGLSPDGIRQAQSPTLKQLCREGAWTFKARAVMPTSSSPNWASMIMGAGPEQHGITSNDWELDKFDIPPTDTGPSGRFPSIFTLLRAQRPDATAAVFYDWDGFGRLVEPRAVNVLADCDGPTNAVRQALTYWRQHRPTLTFIHLDHVDHAGHEHGYGTAEYYASVDVADRLIAEIIGEVGSASSKENTLLIVTSDHGGVGKKHGGATMAEIEIPWITVGPGVRAGYEIRSPVDTFDTAATVAYVLGLEVPRSWIARPVREAFEDPASAAKARGL